MEKPKLLQSFAVNNVGKIVSIREVANGKACDCSCPECGEVVIARQGEIRQWHFAHASGADCSGSAEGALHRAAKQLIVEEGRVLLPSLVVRQSVRLDDGRRGEGSAALPEETAVLTEPRLEVHFGTIRADVAAQYRDEPLLIEIAVTHFADDAKRQELSTLGIACVEIGLSPDPELLWTWDLLRQQVLADSHNREWIFHPERTRLLEEARQLAADDAQRKPPPPVPQSAARSTKWNFTRWWFSGRVHWDPAHLASDRPGKGSIQRLVGCRSLVHPVRRRTPRSAACPWRRPLFGAEALFWTALKPYLGDETLPTEWILNHAPGSTNSPATRATSPAP
jgi:predicted RNA-binding Zn-ribbon protein involved in translation (DUF1610 family)